MASERRAGGSNGAESDGVERLIARLRDQGIAQGQAQADALVAEAKRQAADIVAEARRQADQMRVGADKDVAKLHAAGEDAIRQASRDTMLSLEADLDQRFRTMLRRLVKGTLDDPEFLQRLILEVAGKAAPTVQRGQVLLPSAMVSLADLERKPEEAAPGTLTHFVLAVAGKMLREGVTLGASDEVDAGIRVKLSGDEMELDLTESTLTELLLRHMLPRFRAVLRGAVATRRAAAVSEPEGERPAP